VFNSSAREQALCCVSKFKERSARRMRSRRFLHPTRQGFHGVACSRRLRPRASVAAALVS